MNPYIPEEVQTSISLSIIGLENEKEAFVHFFARSDSDSQLDEVKRSLVSIARISGLNVSERFNSFPGWSPNTNTKIYSLLKESYDELKLYDKPPRVYSIHAGLECGLIIGRYPDMECVSIGPLITNAHTPDEALHIDTVSPFYNVLKDTLIRFARFYKTE